MTVLADMRPAVPCLGERLLSAGRLSPANLDRARRAAEEGGVRLSAALVSLGLVPDGLVADMLAELLELPLVEPSAWPAEPVGSLNPRWLRQARVLPLRENADHVDVAMADPEDAYALQALRLAFGVPVRPSLAPARTIEQAIDRLYGQAADTAGDAVRAADDDVQRLRDLASEAPVVRFVNQMIAAAVDSRASDIHLEPFETGTLLRLRIDGALREVEPPPAGLTPAVVSRLKIMAGLDIAERRMPQDGRIKMTVRGREIDLRLATAPGIGGEGAVLRILDRGAVELDFTRLGFAGPLLADWRAAITRPNGIVLVTGPTGSGKTTTLYASLAELNRPDLKLFTVEDPVEYQLARIVQIQVRPQIGLTFAHVLRSLLRQNPDIIMLGEIRDRETAQISIEASLTGHLVLSTLHTNDAPGAVARLLDMGVEEYLLASTLNAVLAQRLVRTLCPHCRRPHPEAAAVLERLAPDLTAGSNICPMRPVGCPECRGTGWYGRTTIAELLTVTDPVRSAIMGRSDAGAIRRLAAEAGMEGLRRAGLRKAAAGETTADEVLRATMAG